MIENPIIPSNDEMDFYCYGDDAKENFNSGYNQTGWYIYMPQSRLNKIAEILKLSSIYCIGIRKNDGRIFVQTSRRLDPRNHKVEYVEVNPKYRLLVRKVLLEELSKKEKEETIKQDEQLMDLARKGIL